MLLNVAAGYINPEPSRLRETYALVGSFVLLNRAPMMNVKPNAVALKTNHFIGDPLR